MKITIGSACAGHGICESIRPDIFEVGDDGVSRLLTENVTEEDRESIEDAVQQCPTQALQLED